MDDELIKMLEADDLSGDVDAVTARMIAKLDAAYDGVALPGDVGERVAELLQEMYRKDPGSIPEDLELSMLDWGYLRELEDPAIAALFNRLTRPEKEIVRSLEGHFSAGKRTALLSGLQNGTAAVNAQVLAALSWTGLGSLNTMLDQATIGALEAQSQGGGPSAEKNAAAYEKLCDVDLFLIEDEEDLDMDEEDEKVKRRASESTLLDRANFLRQIANSSA